MLSAAEWAAALAAMLLLASALRAQSVGELHIRVEDPAHHPLSAGGTLDDAPMDFHLRFATDAQGAVTLRALSFGWYTIAIEAPGLAPWRSQIQIHSAVPESMQVILRPAQVRQSVTVSAAADDLATDPEMRDYLSGERAREYQPQQIGRAPSDLVAQQPGWILEGNGVLHPRGSEYQTQWVIDGFPLTDNRSVAFAVPPALDGAQSITALTSGYPAEYGRKLGGVVNVVSAPPRPGWHSELTLGGGSFATSSLAAATSYGGGAFSFGGSFDQDQTDRFLDPPGLDNLHNHGRVSHGVLWADIDPSARDRLRFVFDASSLGFQVPNSGPQQLSGQDQARATAEFAGRLSYQRVISAHALLNARFSARDLSASLDANAASTPIVPQQQRGLRELYGAVNGTWVHGRNEWTAGGDLLRSALQENFQYLITDPTAFDPAVPASFSFQGQAIASEPAAYLQDRITFAHWTLQAGLRWDGYRLLVDDHAWSPRLAAVWHSERARVSLHASYDRIFQTPAVENLLLSSAYSAQHLTRDSTGLPVPPSRGDFFEIGAARLLGDKSRFDLSWFDRRSRNFADDDVFLNTGISFPIAFSRAHIYGFEAKYRLSVWKGLSAEAAYSYLVGRARLPVSGGLLLEDSTALLQSAATIAITQDQRNTARAQLRYGFGDRAWISAGERFLSGLPFDGDAASDLATVDPRLIARLDLSRQRIRPFAITDAQFGVRIWQAEHKSIDFSVQAANLFNQVDLIDFAGVFSGTAVGPPRNANARIRIEF